MKNRPTVPSVAIASGLIQSYRSRVLVWKTCRKSRGWLSFTPAPMSKVRAAMSILHRPEAAGRWPAIWRERGPSDSWVDLFSSGPRLAALKSGSAADLILLILQGEPFLLSLVVAVVIGTGVGFLVVWMVTRHTLRMAEQNAAQLLAVARRA